MDEGRRSKIAQEIFDLTQPLTKAADEITVADYIVAARSRGIVYTDRQARCILEQAVVDGTLTRRNIGRNVFYRRKVCELPSNVVQNTDE